MSKIKYAEGQPQLQGKLNGFCFQSNSQLPTMRRNPVMRQLRSNQQTYSQALTGYFVRVWRQLSTAVRQNWNDFASTFPQPSKRNSKVYLTGFQLFVKRHYYLNIFRNDTLSFMESPVMIEYPEDLVTIYVQVSMSKIYLALLFVNADSTLDLIVELSNSQSKGKSFQGSQARFSLKTKNFNQQVDITDSYLSVFGSKPLKNDMLFLSSILCGSDNGQFWSLNKLATSVSSFIPIYSIVKLGFLYNVEALVDPRSICADGWFLPNFLEMIQLIEEIGGQLDGGFHSKEVNDLYWNHINPLGDDSTGFSARGSGYVLPDGSPIGFYGNARYACGVSNPPSLIYAYQINANDSLIQPISLANFNDGLSFRPIRMRDDSITSYTGNDGRVYNVIHTASFTVVAEQLVETKFADGSDIDLCSSSSEWASTASSCYAYPDYQIGNAFFFLEPL